MAVQFVPKKSVPPVIRPGTLPYRGLHALVLRLVGSWDHLGDAERTAIVGQIRQLLPPMVGHLGAGGAEPSMPDVASHPGHDGHQLDVLTPRERQVLSRLADGESTIEIGRRMGIDVETVRTHIKRMLPKLGVHSRVEAVAVYLNRN